MRLMFLLVALSFCATGCCPQTERKAPVLTPVGPDALLYGITATNATRAVQTNGMILGEGSFKDEDLNAILKLLQAIPNIALKVQRVQFFGSPRPVAAEVELPRYTLYFVKPVFEEWKGGAVVIRN